MKRINLTKEQKDTLRLLVNLVRSDKLPEEFTLSQMYGGQIIIGLKDIAEKPQLPKRTISAFVEENCINYSVTPKGNYHIVLLNRAYELVDSEFMEETTLSSSGVTINAERSNFVVGTNYGSQTITIQENPELANAFNQLIELSKTLPDHLQDQVGQTLSWIQGEDKKGTEANETKLNSWVKFLLAMAPDIADVAITTFANPALGASTVLRKISERSKQEQSN